MIVVSYQFNGMHAAGAPRVGRGKTWAAQRHVRRDLRLSVKTWMLQDQLRALCGQAGIVDENGRPRYPEACRLAMLTHLTRAYPNPVNVAVEYAVRAQKLILVASMGRRIARIFSTHDRAVSSSKGGVFGNPSVVHVTLDDWTAEAMQQMEMPYRKSDGMVEDVRLYADVIRAGLNNSTIWTVAAGYQRRMARIRSSVEHLEKYVGSVLVETVGKENFPRERQSRGLAVGE
jgi:hypothetical protein